MNKHLRQPSKIYDRIRKIIEDARSNIAHAVNSEMVIAYWHIGKEIVEEEQKGRHRAHYGEWYSLDYQKGLPRNLVGF